jgi:phospholipid transport system substrate-binding protein
MVSFGRGFARRVTRLVLALMLAVIVLPGVGNAAPKPADTVRHFYDALLSTMQNGANLGQQGRFNKLAPVVSASFDVPYMTRLAVGAAWNTLNDAQRHELANAFGRYITATYAERFDSFSGEKLEVTGEQPYASGAVVDTRIVKSDGEPVTLNYLMRENENGWQIADIYLTGTISELATRRSEFSSIINRQGVSGLIATLNRKTDLLMASNTPS